MNPPAMHLSLKSYSKNVFYQFVVQALTVLRAVVILPVLYKTLGSFYYGIWSQMIITITLLSNVFTLRFDIVLVRYFTGSARDDEFRTAFYSMLFCMILVLLPFCILFMFFSDSLSVLLFDTPSLQPFVFILLALIGLKSIFTYCLSYYRSCYKIGFYSLIQSMQILGEITILFVTIVLLDTDFFRAMISLIFFNALLTFTMMLSVAWQLGVARPDLRTVKPFLLFSLPLIPNVALQWVTNFSDRYFIVHFLDMAHVSIYAACYTLGHMISFFEVPIAFVLYPTISKLWRTRQVQDIRFWTLSSLKLFLLIAVPAVFGLHYFAPDLLHKLTADDFTRHSRLVLMVGTGYVFMGIYQIYVYVVLLAEKTLLTLLIFVFTALSNVVLNILLIPVFGIEGSAFATLVSYFLQAFFIYIAVLKDFHFQFPLLFSIKILTCSVAMYAFLTLFQSEYILANITLAAAAIVLYAALLLLCRVFKKEDVDRIKQGLQF